jgi:mannose/fructose-specific phosphotransferase system component IIA
METPAVIAANKAFEAARSLAEGRKQAAIAAAMKLPMPEHAAAIRAAERAYHLVLAEAAERSGGIIQSAPYRNAAAV